MAHVFLKRCFSLLLIKGLFLCSVTAQSTVSSILPSYDVCWKTPSHNSSESMPLGGGDVGVNVWVEKGDVLLYVAQSGAFDENNQLLKQGRVRIQLRPNPLEGSEVAFCQHLHLRDGNMTIEAGSGSDKVMMNLWVDVHRPVVHVETKSKKPISVKACYETWRTADVEIPMTARHACMSYRDYEGTVVRYKDSVAYENNAVVWFHRNKDDKLLRDFCIAQQGLGIVSDQILDTQKGRTFGGMMFGTGMKAADIQKDMYQSIPYRAYVLQSIAPSVNNHLMIALNCHQYESLGQWKEALQATVGVSKKDVKANERTKLWWNRLWERSYILIRGHCPNPADSVWQVGRNYQLFRYMMGCNAMGEYPSKFNGSLFTFDPVLVDPQYAGVDPDFRQWGGGSYTGQNQRLLYWPLLKSGDFDMMPPQFDYYSRALSTAEARTKVYWGHQGACFTEQLENFGLPFAAGWGFDAGKRERPLETPRGVQSNPWVSYHYVNQLEFSLMILDYYRFSDKEIRSYLPFIKSALRFFDEHYQYEERLRTGKPLNGQGKLVLYPSTAAEMYKMAKNPTDLIAALQAVLTRMLELPLRYVSAKEKEVYQAYLARIPEIPLDKKEGKLVIKPAESWETVTNQEIPELYTLFPYDRYGLTKPNLEIAIDTWYHGESIKMKEFTECWSQVGIFAARLGLAEEAATYIVHKMKNSSKRFPTFWGPGPDWVPDIDHGGSGMIALQEMLMQTFDREILLFPAWPKEWDVKFKLHAPYNTTVEVELKEGKIIHLNVIPKKREADVRASGLTMKSN